MPIEFKTMDTAPTENGSRILCIVKGRITTAERSVWHSRGHKQDSWRLLVAGYYCDCDSVEPALWAEYPDDKKAEVLAQRIEALRELTAEQEELLSRT